MKFFRALKPGEAFKFVPSGTEALKVKVNGMSENFYSYKDTPHIVYQFAGDSTLRNETVYVPTEVITKTTEWI